MQGTDVGATLINCTEDDLYVQAGNSLVKLQVQQPPQAVHATTMRDTLIVATGSGSSTLILENHGSEAVTFRVPEKTDKVRYLVSPEVLASFPHRADFLAVSGYRMVDSEVEGEPSKVVVTKVSSQLPVASADSTAL